MDAFSKVISTVSEAFVFNQATLSGSVDIIVVKQKDGSYKGTGFHARFGKVHAIKSKEKIVRIEVNGAPTNVTMKLGDGGEAYFEEEVIDSAENELSDDSLQSESSPSLDNILSNSTNNLDSKISRNKIQIINNAVSDQVKVERLVSSRVTDHTTGLCRSDNKEEKENELYLDSDKENRNSSLIDINALIEENGMTSTDVEIANKLIHQISADLTIKIALYDESTIGLTSEQIDSIFQKHLVPWVQFVEKPQNYISNNALVISVNNTIFEHKIASYILANLVNSLKNTMNSNSNSAKISPKLVAKVQVQSESETSMLSSTNRVNSPKSLQSASQNKISRVRKCLRLSSEKIKLLNLRPGQNTITYTINTGLQGTQKLQANIYLWSYNTKLIVTDVDGTITKSDFLGAILPILGKDWTQPGIAPLFANINRNGYQILYLTSRAIGQIGFTRDFVKSVHQDGKNLPQGPIISSPDQLLSCFKREIVFSKPEFFKSAALRDIRNLFPADHNPFHAGFGNRENDAVAYRYVGIPLENIFTVNGNGEVHHAAHTLYKSYAYLNAKVKEIFPCIHLKSH